MNFLTKPESKRLAALEGVIDAGKRTFVEVGKALAEIRDSKLYRETHTSFDAYCKERWSWGKTYAYRLIEASAIKESPIGNHIANEAQAREVAKVPEEQRPAVVAAAVERAASEDRDLTARDIAEAAKPALTPAEVRQLEAAAVEPEPMQPTEDDALGELMLGVCSLAQSITRSADKTQMQGFSRRLRGLAALAEELSEQM